MASYRVTTYGGIQESRISKGELLRILIPAGIDPNIVTAVRYDNATDELVFTLPPTIETFTVPLTTTDPPPVGP